MPTFVVLNPRTGFYSLRLDPTVLRPLRALPNRKHHADPKRQRKAKVRDLSYAQVRALKHRMVRNVRLPIVDDSLYEAIRREMNWRWSNGR